MCLIQLSAAVYRRVRVLSRASPRVLSIVRNPHLGKSTSWPPVAHAANAPAWLRYSSADTSREEVPNHYSITNELLLVNEAEPSCGGGARLFERAERPARDDRQRQSIAVRHVPDLTSSTLHQFIH